MAESLWITVWSFLKKLNIELPYDPTISFLSILKRIENKDSDAHKPMFIIALFTIVKK